MAETPPGAAPITRKRSRLGWSRNRDWILSILFGVVGIALLELFTSIGVISELIIPKPSNVGVALYNGWTTGLFSGPLLSTVGGALVGFLIAAFLAIAFAVAVTSVPILERILTPYVVALQSVPKIALAPIAVIWLGFGPASKILVVVLSCFFPIAISTIQGLRLRDRDSYDLFRALGASRWQVARLLRLPSAVPYIFAGLHVGIVLALIGAVTAEFVGSRNGLGVLLLQLRAQFDLPGVFATIIVMTVVGIVFYWGMSWVEQRAAFWGREISTVVTP